MLSSKLPVYMWRLLHPRPVREFDLVRAVVLEGICPVVPMHVQSDTQYGGSQRLCIQDIFVSCESVRMYQATILPYAR